MNSNKAHQVGPQGPLHSKYSANTFCFSHFIQAVVDFFFFLAFSFIVFLCSLLKEKVKEAEEIYQAGIKNCPDSSDLHNNYGVFLVDTGKYS